MPKTTPKVTIVDTEYATLWFYPKTKILHHKIYKFMPAGAHQELLTAGAKYLEKHKASKWLSDNRGNTVVRQEDTQWGTTVWGPRAVRAGFKYWAVLMPAQPIGKMQMRKLIESFGQLGVTVQAFEDVDDAMKWLESVGKVVKN